MLKRIITILTVAVLAVLMAACSNGTSSAQSTSGKVYAQQNFDGSTGTGMLPPVTNSAGELVVASQVNGAALTLTTYDLSGKKKAEITTDVKDAVTQFTLDGKDTAYAMTFPDHNTAKVHVLDNTGKTSKTVTISDLPQGGMMIGGKGGKGGNTSGNGDKTGSTSGNGDKAGNTSGDVNKAVNTSGGNGPETPKGAGITGFTASSDGSIFLCTMEAGVLQYDSTGKQVRTYGQGAMDIITMNEKEQLVVISMAEGVPTLTTYDTQSGSEAAKINAPLMNVDWLAYDKAGKRLLYLNENGINPIKTDGTTGEALIKLTDFNIGGSGVQISGYTIDGAGSIYISSIHGGQTSGMQVKGGGNGVSLSFSNAKADRIDRLVLVDASSVPQKKVITLAGLSENTIVNEAISTFQTDHPDYKIEVKSYVNQIIGMKQSGNVDIAGLIQQFNTDILSQNSADIFLLDDLPYYKYIDKGILADIGQMMTDSGMDMSQYYSNVFDACKVNGKLYTLPIAFEYTMLTGKAANMPTSETPTVSEFLHLANSLPTGMAAFPKEEALRAFGDFMDQNYSYFVDQNARTAKFNSPEFIQLLNDFKTLADSRMGGKTLEEQVDFEQVGNGSIAFIPIKIRRLEELSMASALIGEDMKLTCMPSMQSGAYTFNVRGMFGINASSPNKEMAWEFLKTLLSTEIQSNQRFDALPVNKQANATKMNQLKTAGTLGKEGSRLVININGKEIEAKPLSAQQYDAIAVNFDKFNTLVAPDENVYKILDEELPSFFSGQKSAQEVADLIQNRVQIILSE